MKILISFASTTGNTQTVAESIKNYLNSNAPQDEITLIDMEELNPNDLSNYDLVFIGSSTWGDGELNDVSEEFFDNLDQESIDLSKTKFAVFGLGEKFYKNFCAVVDIMKELLSKKNAIVLENSMKIDGYPDKDVIKSVESWVATILKSN